MNRTFGTVFDIQHFSVSDGPGIRTTVFLKGCPLRCTWCHNPESYELKPQVLYYEERCAVCGACAEVCQNRCHHIEEGVHRFDRAHCSGCGLCEKACPGEALRAVGKRKSVEEVLEEVAEDLFFYETSGGGLTLSGGEPMFQPEFSVCLARNAKAMGISVCMETSGFCKTEHMEAILPFVDLFLFDYKVTAEERHRAYTGVSPELILHNLSLLDKKGAKIVLRCPMIPGRNMEDAHIEGIIRAAKSLRHLLEIHLEPYHNVGVSKRAGLGMEEESLAPPAREELLARAAEIQEKTGVTVKVL